MLHILFSASAQRWAEYETPLNEAFAKEGLKVDLACDHRPEIVDYIIFAPNGPVQDFSPFSRTKAVMGLWAGVETVVDNPTLTQPLCRLVDHSLTAGMVEWVTGHTLRHHLGLDRHINGQDGVWRGDDFPPLAKDRPVTVLGLGALGAACGQALARLGFPVTGWSRRSKKIPRLRCLSGDAGLDAALRGAQIVILLLPQTPATTHILNAARLAELAPGAFVINPGRGPLIDDNALLGALNSGQIAHATLDVFTTEPLPKDHPYWAHAHVTVTPHIASTTRPDSAAATIAGNIAGAEAGAPLQFLVDRRAGY